MSGSPPQIETIGALHSSAAPRQSSSDIMSLSEVEYSRMRPQPVQVRLQVWSGSSWSTVANFSVPRSLLPMIYAAIFVVSARGNLIRARIVTRLPCLSTEVNVRSLALVSRISPAQASGFVAIANQPLVSDET